MKPRYWILPSVCTTVFCTVFAQSFNPFWKSGPLNYSTEDRSPPPKYCSKPAPARMSLRHIEPKGIGYRQGYTTVSGFFTPFWSSDINRLVPFMDLRVHVFDDSRFASNAGLGLRYLSDCCVWGINTYYDFRQTSRHNYNQVAAGLEALGKIWDFRINGYLPLGGKTTSLYNTQFQKFQGHYLYLRSTKQFAMKGANAELGAHIGKRVPLYFAGGPYFLNGQGKSAWGGQLRGSIDLFGNSIGTSGMTSLNKGFIRLEGNVSYDQIFKWIGQGQISFNIALGGKQDADHKKTCSRSRRLLARALQDVDRMEIVPVSQKHVSTKALDPNGNPYFFWFVNNTSSSDGSFEHPFPTLIQAQDASSPGDVIYVFPGDGTTMGMDAGMVLQPNQRFWGSGFEHTLPTQFGNITIPALTTTSPTMTNGGGDGIALASGNEVSGFIVSSPTGNGISGTDVGRMTIMQTMITGAGADGIVLTPSTSDVYLLMRQLNISGNAGNAINLQATGGINADMIVAESSITGNGAAAILVADSTMTNFNQTIVENNISGNHGTKAIYISAITATNFKQTVARNNISGNQGNGVYVGNGSTITTMNQSITYNIISNNTANVNAEIIVTDLTVQNLNQNISNNIISNNQANGIIIEPTTSHAWNFAIINNIITGNQLIGIVLQQNSPLTAVATILNNTLFGNESGSPSLEAFNSNASAKLCIDLENNKSDNGYLINNSIGTIHLAPTNVYSINTGPFNIPSHITPQASCP